MENSSEIVVFVLQGLNDSLPNRQLYFSLALVSYLFTVFVNLMLVVTIVLEKTLHEPMYIFVCNMCLNEIYGASSFYPKLLHDLLADAQVISFGGCMTQIFAVYNYVFCQFSCLTVMAYDRYVAICRPLQYQLLMSAQKAVRLLLLTWAFCLLECSVGITLTTRLSFCGRRLPKIFCTNWEVVKLSCSDTTLNNIYGFVVMFSHVSQAALILVSYVHLVRASLRSQANRRKFMQTCLPHLITLLVFTASVVFDAMFSRYGGGGSTVQVLRNALAAEVLVIPPIINPIIYGINLQQIRVRILQNFSTKPNVHR